MIGDLQLRMVKPGAVLINIARGTIVDESAGSSGTPFNWLRSAAELQDVHKNTANWIRFSFPTDRLEADLRQALGVRLECRVVAPGTLPRTELKSRRLLRVDSGG